MNLIETLSNEIKDMHLTDFEKVRYIYLRCCQVFSFDERYFYYPIWRDYGLSAVLEKKKIDLENIVDPRIICHTISRYVYRPLIEELTTLDPYVCSDGAHSYVRVRCGANCLTLDPVKGDFTRVKVNLKPKDFLVENMDPYGRTLEEIDEELGFKFIDDDSKLIDTSEDRKPIEIIKDICNQINTHNFKTYNDPAFLFQMFAPIDDLLHYTYLSKDYDFIKIVQMLHNEGYFELSNQNGIFKMLPTDYERLKELRQSKVYKSRI